MTAAAARILRVVFDHPNNTVDLVYSQASSIVISLANEAMIAISTRWGIAVSTVAVLALNYKPGHGSLMPREMAGSIVSRLGFQGGSYCRSGA
jgi:hypothetical protein